MLLHCVVLVCVKHILRQKLKDGSFQGFFCVHSSLLNRLGLIPKRVFYSVRMALVTLLLYKNINTEENNYFSLSLCKRLFLLLRKIMPVFGDGGV